MNRPVKLGNASLQALALVVVLGAVAHAGLPYLPLVGPPPLRQQVIKAPSTAAFKVEPPVPPAVTAMATNTNAPAVAETKIESTPFPGTTNSAGGDTPIVMAPLTNSMESTNGPFTGSIFTLPTPDLLGITPQMLATYFHPVQFGSYGSNAVVAVPFPLSFQPPRPMQKSSHAEYIVK